MATDPNVRVKIEIGALVCISAIGDLARESVFDDVVLWLSRTEPPIMTTNRRASMATEVQGMNERARAVRAFWHIRMFVTLAEQARN
jgi:hypothetical protein